MAIGRLCFFTAGILLPAMLTGSADAAVTRKVTLDAFSVWKCDGTTVEGCSGDILFLAHSHDFDEDDSGAVNDKIKGITVWPELKLSVRRALASK